MYKYKLGIDFHGVITDEPDKYMSLMQSIMRNDGEVHLMTGSTEKYFLEEIVNYGYPELKIHYTHFFSISDYLAEKYPDELKFVNGKPRIEDKFKWDRCKADYAMANQLDLVIDDSAHYGQFFTTPFCVVRNDKTKKIFEYES